MSHPLKAKQPTTKSIEDTHYITSDIALNIAVLAGELMMKNGAETYRVEDTMDHMMRSCGYFFTDSYATTTGIIASIHDDKENMVTTVRRLDNRTYNFTKVTKVNQISRSFSNGELTPQQVYRQLKEIEEEDVPYSANRKIFWCGIACASFSMILGGGYKESINAFIVGLVLQLVLNNAGNLPAILQNMLGGATLTFMAFVLINLGLGTNVDSIVVGSLMPLLPGTAFTNAIRDFAGGDFVSGSARITDALLSAVCVATGIATTISFWLYIVGDVYL